MQITRPELAKGLTTLGKYASELPLVPKDEQKRPVGLHLNWQKKPILPRDLKRALQKRELSLQVWKDKSQGLWETKELSDQVYGYGVVLGYRFSYQCKQVCLVGIDIDGKGGEEVLNNLIKKLPPTVAWSSGKPHHATYLYHIGTDRENDIKTKKFKSGDDKLELRFRDLAVTLPPSVHPETGSYQFLPGASFEEVAIAELPEEIYMAMLKSPKQATQQISMEMQGDIALPVNAAVPLIECCRKEVRDWISNGVPVGSGHNDAALSVAKELVAVQRYLESINQHFDADAEHYYLQFLSSSGVESGTLEMGRFEDALNKNDLEPSCKPDGVNNCIRGWYYREVLKLHPAIAKSNGNGNGKGADYRKPEDVSDLWDKFVKIYQEEHTVRDQEAKRVALVASSGITQREGEVLWRKVCDYCERNLNLDIASESFKKFLAAESDLIELEDVLPLELSKQLTIAAEGKCHPLRYLSYLWPAAANLIGGKVFVWGNEVMKWKSDLVFFTVDVGPSSAGKTPAANDIMFYLRNKQAQSLWAEEDGRRTLARLKAEWADMTEPQKDEFRDDPNINPKLYARNMPVYPTWIFDNPTLGALEKSLQEQSKHHSAIWFSKELASILSSLDQFKSGGRGNDRQFLLDAYDGRIYRKSDRKTDQSTTNIQGQMLQLCGGTQMDVLRRYLSLTDYQDGLTNRFLMIDPPAIAPPERMPTEINNACEILTHVFSRLESIPVELDDRGEPLQYGMRFDPEAALYWESCWVSIRKKITEEESIDPNFASYLGKLVTYYIRLAALISLIWQALDTPKDQALIPEQIPLHIAEKTFRLIEYYASQYIKIRQVSNDTDKNTAIFADIWRYAQSKGSISARDVQRYFGKGKLKSQEAKDLLQQLADSGCGELETKGRSTLLHYRKLNSIERTVNFTPKPTLKAGVAVQTTDGEIGWVYEVKKYTADVVLPPDGAVKTFYHEQLSIQN